MTIAINRWTFLAAAGVFVAARAVIGVRQAHAAVMLTFGHGAAPGNPRAVAAEAFAKLVAERTGGSVAIKIAGSETLGNDVAMLTSLRTGVLDLTANSQGAASGLVPELSVLGLPFLFPNAEAAVKLLNGPVGETLEKKFEAVNIIPLDWWDNGIRHTTNSRRAINTPARPCSSRPQSPNARWAIRPVSYGRSSSWPCWCYWRSATSRR